MSPDLEAQRPLLPLLPLTRGYPLVAHRRRLCPKLVSLREEVLEGMYTLVLEFESKDLTEQQW